ncbi:MAG: DNA polymerase III subunit delta [Candidatus Yanofskybacteria bacterium]|nr:DNA polymerase III subunit delta [Candidatus Yanofskybacteria bacterium]
MIIFLYGRDDYRLKQNLDKIVEEYKSKHPIGTSFNFDLSQAEQTSKFEDALRAVSFFDEKKLIIIRGAFDHSVETTKIIERQALPDDPKTISIFVENTGEDELTKKDKKLWLILSAKPNIVKGTESLDIKKLEAWVKKEAASLNCSIDLPAIKKLVWNTMLSNEKKEEVTDSWRIRLELEKLANYKSGGQSGSTISEADIDLLVKPAVDLNIFHLVDAIANRFRLRAAVLIEENVEAGQEPFYILSMIAYQMRNLLKVKALAENAVPLQTIIKKTGLNPFVARKAYEQSKKYSLGELKKLFGQLANIDVEVKSGLVDITDAIFQFALST